MPAAQHVKFQYLESNKKICQFAKGQENITHDQK